MEYCVPYTIGRGYCSLDPRKRMADRFAKSGKDTLVVITLSDFDPDGLRIAESFARSMRDDFGIEDVVAKAAALSWSQVQERQLPQTFDIPPEKWSSTKFVKHREQYGMHFHELEALSNDERAEMLENAIKECLDLDLYNQEVEREEADAAGIEQIRQKIGPLLKSVMS